MTSYDSFFFKDFYTYLHIKLYSFIRAYTKSTENDMEKNGVLGNLHKRPRRCPRK